MVGKAMVAKSLYLMTYKCSLFVIPTNGGCSEQQVGSYMKQVEHNDYIYLYNIYIYIYIYILVNMLQTDPFKAS